MGSRGSVSVSGEWGFRSAVRLGSGGVGGGDGEPRLPAAVGADCDLAALRSSAQPSARPATGAAARRPLYVLSYSRQSCPSPGFGASVPESQPSLGRSAPN